MNIVSAFEGQDFEISISLKENPNDKFTIDYKKSMNYFCIISPIKTGEIVRRIRCTPDFDIQTSDLKVGKYALRIIRPNGEVEIIGILNIVDKIKDIKYD